MTETRQYTDAQRALLLAAGPEKTYREAVEWLAEACRLAPVTVHRYLRLGVDCFTTAEMIVRLTGCKLDILLPREGAASTRRRAAGRNRKGNQKRGVGRRLSSCAP